MRKSQNDLTLASHSKNTQVGQHKSCTEFAWRRRDITQESSKWPFKGVGLEDR